MKIIESLESKNRIGGDEFADLHADDIGDDVGIGMEEEQNIYSGKTVRANDGRSAGRVAGTDDSVEDKRMAMRSTEPAESKNVVTHVGGYKSPKVKGGIRDGDLIGDIVFVKNMAKGAEKLTRNDPKPVAEETLNAIAKITDKITYWKLVNLAEKFEVTIAAVKRGEAVDPRNRMTLAELWLIRDIADIFKEMKDPNYGKTREEAKILHPAKGCCVSYEQFCRIFPREMEAASRGDTTIGHDQFTIPGFSSYVAEYANVSSGQSTPVYTVPLIKKMSTEERVHAAASLEKLLKPFLPEEMGTYKNWKLGLKESKSKDFFRILCAKPEYLVLLSNSQIRPFQIGPFVHDFDVYRLLAKDGNVLLKELYSIDSKNLSELHNLHEKFFDAKTSIIRDNINRVSIQDSSATLLLRSAAKKFMETGARLFTKSDWPSTPLSSANNGEKIVATPFGFAAMVIIESMLTTEQDLRNHVKDMFKNLMQATAREILNSSNLNETEAMSKAKLEVGKKYPKLFQFAEHENCHLFDFPFGSGTDLATISDDKLLEWLYERQAIMPQMSTFRRKEIYDIKHDAIDVSQYDDDDIDAIYDRIRGGGRKPYDFWRRDYYTPTLVERLNSFFSRH
ncbi:MAG: hypothetical protein LBT64_01580 [Puniceicoccales bacterium]|nr:hypothetical protein [Puniceicoccales bacterium]